MNGIQLSEIRVGEPVRCGGMTVFPLFAERSLFPASFNLESQPLGLAITHLGDKT